MKNRKPRLKKLPALESDEDAETFVAKADLTQYEGDRQQGTNRR